MPIGAIGEICIAGAGLARGYLNAPELTNEKFICNPAIDNILMYRTGDLGKWLEDGNVQFLGRKDTQVKIRGFRIELGEIEAQILEYPGIKRALVLEKKINNDALLCAYVVASAKIDNTALKNHLQKRLPYYMLPAFIIPVDTIPLSPSGKVNTQLLPEPILPGSETCIAPRDNQELQLAAVFSELLNIEQVKIGVNMDFYQLGGDSLKIIELASAIHKKFNVKLKLMDIITHSTIESLSEVIQKANRDDFRSIEPAVKKDNYPVSSEQMRLYTLQQISSSTTSYNISSIMLQKDIMDNRKIKHAACTIIKHYDILRTAFRETNGQIIQSICENIECNVECFNESDTEKANAVINGFVRPFDLSNPPLFRIGLINLPNNQQILMFDIHHIVADGIALELIIRDFFTVYNGHDLPSVRLHYRDYSEWQAGDFYKKLVEKGEKFWLEQFASGIPCLNLPVDYPRKKMRTFNGAIHFFEINSELNNAIWNLIEETRSTLFIFLLSVYYLFLSGYCSQDDIIIGCPVTGRNHADLQNIIGTFINMLAIRLNYSKDSTFTDMMDGIKFYTTQAFEYQNFQFDMLIRKLKIKHDPARNALFDVALNILELEDEDTLSGSSYKLKHINAKYDLFLRALVMKKKLVFSLEYSTDIFKEDTVKMFSGLFLQVVRQVTENKKIKLGEIRLAYNYDVAHNKGNESDIEFAFYREFTTPSIKNTLKIE